MMQRGFEFLPCDLYKSQATKCIIEDGKIRLPFTALGGTGETAAKNIVDARGSSDFISIEDLKQRAKLSSAVIERLDENGCWIVVPQYIEFNQPVVQRIEAEVRGFAVAV